MAALAFHGLDAFAPVAPHSRHDDGEHVASVLGCHGTKEDVHRGAATVFWGIVVQADAVARAGYLGFVLGWRVTVPGLINPCLALALRVMC